MSDFIGWLKNTLGSDQDWQWKLFLSVALILLILLLRKLALILAFRRHDDIRIQSIPSPATTGDKPLDKWYLDDLLWIISS